MNRHPLQLKLYVRKYCSSTSEFLADIVNVTTSSLRSIVSFLTFYFIVHELDNVYARINKRYISYFLCNSINLFLLKKL